MNTLQKALKKMTPNASKMRQKTKSTFEITFSKVFFYMSQIALILNLLHCRTNSKMN